MEAIVNKVAASGLITLDPADFLPEAPVLALDLKPFLIQGLLLKEKEFRQSMKEQDWKRFEGRVVAVYCSTDAIIPMWAYMLVTSLLSPYTDAVFFGPPEAALAQYVSGQIRDMDLKDLEGQRIVVKGCGDREVPADAYLALAQVLQPIVKSIMFGEPCSTVPVYKRPSKGHSTAE